MRELGFGLFDRRGVLEELVIDAVDVALRIALQELGDHLTWGLVERIGEAELCRSLDEIGLGLADGGKGLFELGRHLAEVIAAFGLEREAEEDALLVNALERFLDLGLGHFEQLPAEVELFLGDGPGLHQRLGALEIGLGAGEGRLLRIQRGDLGPQQRDLVVHIFNSVIEVEAQAPHLPFGRAGVGLGCQQIGLGRRHRRAGDVELDLERLLIQLHEQVALADADVVIDQDVHDLAGDARGDERHVAVDEGIVRGDGREGADERGDDEVREGGEEEQAGQQECPAFAGGPSFDRCRGWRCDLARLCFRFDHGRRRGLGWVCDR